MTDDTAQNPSPAAESPSATASAETAGNVGAAQNAGAAEPTGNAGLGRRMAWTVIALICVVGGLGGSLLKGEEVAANDSAKARQGFRVSAGGIASALKLATQREEDLVFGASTFFASNPQAGPAEFTRWAGWTHLVRRYPELERLGLVTLVRSSELPAFKGRITGHPRSVSNLSRSDISGQASVAASLRIQPPGHRPYYCLTAATLSRGFAKIPLGGIDYCALTPGLLASRASGARSYTQASTSAGDVLAIVTPIYRGGALPSSHTGRKAAFTGWLRAVLAPKVLLRAALRSSPGEAVQLRYRAGTSNVAFTSGTPRAGAQTAITSFHNGWTAAVFGPPVAAGPFASTDARAVFIAGCLLSVLLGMLIYLIGPGFLPALPARPERTRKPRTPRTEAAGGGAEAPRAPHEDLYDGLTGLPNRALTDELAARLVARAARQSGMLAGALLVDIDGFADSSERLGRSAADQLLNVVAERLEGVVRAGDIVGRAAEGRFVVLVEAEARGARLDSLARRMIESLHTPIEREGLPAHFALTTSIGLTFGRYTSSEELLRDAELALQAANAAGGARYALFNANMRSVTEGRGVLEAELNAALLESQFFLLYQPILDLRTHRIVALEALIRWRHPTKGVLLPAEFLPLAEETGLIVPIGRWVLEEACSRTAAWNVAGHRVGVSTMVSSGQLNREGFAVDVRRALQQSGIEPSRLTLEIAESTVMLDAAAAAERIGQAKDLGVRVAIDDFGSGYAYRSDLQKMPLDFLKVDRSSLAASDDEDYRSWLLEAILIFGRDLSLTVIAKGIESEEQLSTLQAMGCTMGQGYFIGEPVTIDGVEDMLQSGLRTAQAGSSNEPA